MSESSSRTRMFCFNGSGRSHNDFNRNHRLDRTNYLSFVSAKEGCYHQSVNRLKTFPAKIALAAALVASAVMYATSPAAVVLPPVPSTVDSITPGELRMHLQFLASEELGGRYTLSPSFAIAARYLASHLEAYGFKGAGDHGEFLQTFQVISAKPDTSKSSLEVTIQGQAEVLPLWRLLHSSRRWQWRGRGPGCFCWSRDFFAFATPRRLRRPGCKRENRPSCSRHIARRGSFQNSMTMSAGREQRARMEPWASCNCPRNVFWN